LIVGKKPYHGWWVLASAVTVLTNGFALSAFALPVFYPEFVQAHGLTIFRRSCWLPIGLSGSAASSWES
jgi:hypothetical protein